MNNHSFQVYIKTHYGWLLKIGKLLCKADSKQMIKMSAHCADIGFSLLGFPITTLYNRQSMYVHTSLWLGSIS